VQPVPHLPPQRNYMVVLLCSVALGRSCQGVCSPGYTSSRSPRLYLPEAGGSCPSLMELLFRLCLLPTHPATALEKLLPGGYQVLQSGKGSNSSVSRAAWHNLYHYGKLLGVDRPTVFLLKSVVTASTGEHRLRRPPAGFDSTFTGRAPQGGFGSGGHQEIYCAYSNAQVQSAIQAATPP
jgi:hypothetical protein